MSSLLGFNVLITLARIETPGVQILNHNSIALFQFFLNENLPYKVGIDHYPHETDITMCSLMFDFV
jgi:hypothetical protein